jgi:hypothetical protein
MSRVRVDQPAHGIVFAFAGRCGGRRFGRVSTV